MIAVLLSIAGLFVPMPMMMLAVLTGIVQAYIFSVLTMVYLTPPWRPRRPLMKEPLWTSTRLS